jgi:hypothetical protein
MNTTSPNTTATKLPFYVIGMGTTDRLEYLAFAAAAGVGITITNPTLAQQARLAGSTAPTLREARRAAGAPIRGYKKQERQPKTATPDIESSFDGVLRVLRAVGSKSLLDLAARIEREELAERHAAAARANGNGAAHRNGNGAIANP